MYLNTATTIFNKVETRWKGHGVAMTGSALLYQTINMLVVILMLPLLLRYLDVNGFILWSIFATIEPFQRKA